MHKLKSQEWKETKQNRMLPTPSKRGFQQSGVVYCLHFLTHNSQYSLADRSLGFTAFVFIMETA
jgi:hypothetical protein